MSTETDDKVQSKFPRESLRARNKTLMITPADVADYQVRSDEQAEASLDLEDVFEDSLSSFDEEFGDGEAVAEPTVRALSEEINQPAHEASNDTIGALSDIWGDEDALGEENDGDEEIKEDTEQLVLDDSEDVFATPAGGLPEANDLFGVLPTVQHSDPIVRETRSIQNVSPASLDAEVSPVPSPEYVEWKKPSKLVGFLVSYASDPMGGYCELREGRLLVTNGLNSTDSCFVIEHETVSPMHAIMRIAADGSILILDQLSEHGTRIRRGEDGKEESLMGDKSTIFHGDVVVFGECEYHVVVMGAAALKREA